MGRRLDRFQRSLAWGGQVDALLRLSGHALVSRMIGPGLVVVVAGPFVLVGSGPVVAVLDPSGLLRVHRHRAGCPRVNMACGALCADTVCVHKCEEQRGQPQQPPRTRCTKAGPQHAEGGPGRNHAAEHSRSRKLRPVTGFPVEGYRRGGVRAHRFTRRW